MVHRYNLAENFQVGQRSLWGMSILFNKSCLQTPGALEQLQLCFAVIWKAEERWGWSGNKPIKHLKWTAFLLSLHISKVCVVWSYLFHPHHRFCCVAVCFEALAEHCCATRLNLRVNRLVSFDSKLQCHLRVTCAVPQTHPGMVFLRRKDDSFDKGHEVGITKAM